GGVSLFVAFFVLAPMAQELFRAADIPRRLMPAAIMLGTSTFTMSALPGTPSIQNAIPMPFFGTTPFAAPGLGILASLIMLGFGLWWLGREERTARRIGEGFGSGAPMLPERLATDEKLRERATTAREFDPAEIAHGEQTDVPPPITLAALPLVVVVAVNLAMSQFILPPRQFAAQRRRSYAARGLRFDAPRKLSRYCHRRNRWSRHCACHRDRDRLHDGILLSRLVIARRCSRQPFYARCASFAGCESAEAVERVGG